MKPHLKRALQFIAAHPGHRVPAFLGGWRYHFDAPELKRLPFRVSTINELVQLGLVDAIGKHSCQKVQISTQGQAALTPP